MDWDRPELVFGLVGPIGIEMETVQRLLAEALQSVGYASVPIRLTSLMEQVDVGLPLDDTRDPIAYYNQRIAYANAVREKCKSDAALAALAMTEIRSFRKEQNEASGVTHDDSRFGPDEIPLERHAYIIRQLKRPEEIRFLREVYGRKFLQVSVSLSKLDRIEAIARKIESRNSAYDHDRCNRLAEELVSRDFNEYETRHGQRIGEVFHLGDVFVSAKSEAQSSETIRRFIDALFGKVSISPSRDEYGSYIAASASLRSLDVSRQVGAALFNPSGEVISLGTNEVPAPGGGTYWPDHAEPSRDVDRGYEANSARKRRLLFDFLSRLKDSELVAHEGPLEELFEEVLEHSLTKDSLLMDITEFGRMTHAEMTAIMDAARLGLATQDGTLFVTTFPCHNCAKHIVASGIKRVVFIEPYEKSQAVDLHGDSISLEERHDTKVVFEHFIGISPRRYRDIFEKGSRKHRDGSIREWLQDDGPLPMIEDKSPYYVLNEPSAIFSALEPVAAELGIEV